MLESLSHLARPAMLAGILLFASLTTTPTSVAMAQTNAVVVTPSSINTINSTTPSLLFIGEGANKDQTALFQQAIAAASNFDITLFIRGRVNLASPIGLPSNTRIVGIGTAASIRNYPNPLEYILRVEDQAENVTLQNVELAEGPRVAAGLLVFGGRNKNITIAGVEFVGQNVLELNFETAGIILSKFWAKDVSVKDCSFSGLQYGVHTVAPVQGMAINNCKFTQWTDFAIRVFNRRQYNSRRIRDVQLSGNHFFIPAKGEIKTMIFVSGGYGDLALNVDVTNNRVVGPNKPWLRSAATSNNGTTDQIIIHRCNQFRITDNIVISGGENGITASRLSRNGVIARNLIYNNDGNGIAIGSGFAELTVDSPDNFEIGDDIVGQSTGTIGIVQDKVGATISVRRVLGGTIFLSEALSNLTTGQANAATVIVNNRTKKIDIVDNEIYDNGQNREQNAYHKLAGIFVKDSDSISIRRNQIFTTGFASGNPSHDYTINVSNSRNLLIDNTNVFELGEQTLGQAVIANRSSWFSGDK